MFAACVAHGEAASSPNDRVMFAIPAGRLDVALRRLATQTGQQILFDPAVIGGRTSAALHGRSSRSVRFGFCSPIPGWWQSVSAPA